MSENVLEVKAGWLDRLDTLNHVLQSAIEVSNEIIFQYPLSDRTPCYPPLKTVDV